MIDRLTLGPQDQFCGVAITADGAGDLCCSSGVVIKQDLRRIAKSYPMSAIQFFALGVGGRYSYRVNSAIHSVSLGNTDFDETIDEAEKTGRDVMVCVNPSLHYAYLA